MTTATAQKLPRLLVPVNRDADQNYRDDPQNYVFAFVFFFFFGHKRKYSIPENLVQVLIRFPGRAYGFDAALAAPARL
jgi:hypothetical protein